MSTVEAIQALLEGHGLILYPGTPNNPPTTISDSDVVSGNYRVFPVHNEYAPVFNYERDRERSVWRFKKRREATKTFEEEAQ